MYRYYAYGLTIHSEIVLSGVRPSENPADVTVRIGAVHRRLNLTLEDVVFCKFENLGFCLISHGKSITFEPCEGITHDMIAPNILGGCMSIILRQRGHLVLHASSISIGNAAIGFVGGSCWGKSTLAAALHIRNYPILTDDVLALKLEGCSAKVIPSFPQCKLSPEAAISIGKDPTTLSPLFTHAHKKAYNLKEGFLVKPLPLKKLYILDKGCQHSIVPMSPSEAFVHIVRHTRATGTLLNSSMLQAHFKQCTDLLQKVRCYRFIRKAGLSELPDLVQLVTNHANDVSLEASLPSSPPCSLAER